MHHEVKMRRNKLLIALLLTILVTQTFCFDTMALGLPKLVKLWEKEAELQASTVKPMITDQYLLYFRELGHGVLPLLELLYCDQAETGLTEWSFPIVWKLSHSSSLAGLTAYKDKLYIAEFITNYTFAWLVCYKIPNLNSYILPSFWFKDLHKYLVEGYDYISYPLVTENEVFLGVGSYLLSFNSNTGALLKEQKIDGAKLIAPYYTDKNRIVCKVQYKNLTKIFCLDTDMKTLWELEPIVDNPSFIANGEDLFYWGLSQSTARYHMASVNLIDGKPNWSKDYQYVAEPKYYQGKLFFESYDPDKKVSIIVSINSSNGEKLWERGGVDDDMMMVDVADGSLYATCRAGKRDSICKLKMETGEDEWCANVEDTGYYRKIAYKDGRFYYQNDEKIYCYILFPSD